MFKGSATVVITQDRLPEMEKGLKQLADFEVLVGIPEEKTDREEVPDIGPVTNAELAFIHTHGSPMRNIPPRPIIEPAIEDSENSKAISEDLKLAIQAALDGDRAKTISQLNKAGISAQNAVRDWFTNPRNNWAPNSPRTIAKKKSDRPLIDTGQLRKAISYVVRKKGE